MRESILPRMHIRMQDAVLGGIIKHVSDRKMVIILGEPGEGKTVTALDFTDQNPDPTYYHKCTANTTMNSMLIFMANAIGIRIVGGNDELQSRIQRKLREDPHHCFIFDEAEYLAYGNGAKIDVLRQIYDETSVPIIICGTYVLKDLISGVRKKKVTQTHNRPQIFRRLRKEEFDRIEVSEIHDYLIQLEKQYAIFFEPQVKTALISRCRDRQSGGLGNFIEILELMISHVRPEWEDISYQIIAETGRILHDHTEEIQSYTSIKPSRYDSIGNEEEENIEIVVNAVNVPTTDSKHELIDVSALTTVSLDMALLNDALRHKMSM